jgi:tryptophanyl-tRNA synthetase
MLSDAPLLPGTDGGKMSKSRGNTIPLSATADETARIIKRAVTDSDPAISYDPERRPAVSGLLQLAALCTGSEPRQVAERITGGAAEMKLVVTEAVNEYFRPLRERRAELITDPGQLRRVLRDGNEHAATVAAATLAEVRTAMGMDYTATA